MFAMQLNLVLEEKSKLLVDINDLNERLRLVENLEDTRWEKHTVALC